MKKKKPGDGVGGGGIRGGGDVEGAGYFSFRRRRKRSDIFGMNR